MKFLRLALCSLPPLSLSLAHPAVDQQHGSVQIYSDNDCKIRNGSAVAILVNTCLPMNGSSSISAATLPSCENGASPILTISDQENCGPPSIIAPSISSGNVGICLFYPTGRTIASARFACVGQSATPSSSGTKSGTTATLEPVSAASSTVAQPTTADPQPTANNDEPPPSPLLPINDRIALGVGIGIGIPTLVVGFFSWWISWRKWRHHRHALRDGRPPPYEMDWRN